MADPDLDSLPNRSAAVLDVLYTANEQTDDAPIIQKPAPAAEVVARAEDWLT